MDTNKLTGQKKEALGVILSHQLIEKNRLAYVFTICRLYLQSNCANNGRNMVVVNHKNWTKILMLELDLEEVRGGKQQAS